MFPFAKNGMITSHSRSGQYRMVTMKMQNMVNAQSTGLIHMATMNRIIVVGSVWLNRQRTSETLHDMRGEQE